MAARNVWLVGTPVALMEVLVMNVVNCPHCGNHRIVTQRVPKDAVVVMQCPNCSELGVFFRNKVMALNRQILENGSIEEKKAHIAEIIAEFLEPGMLNFPMSGMLREGDDESMGDGDEFPEMDSALADAPISQTDMDEFLELELHRIDEEHYFKKYFG